LERKDRKTRKIKNCSLFWRRSLIRCKNFYSYKKSSFIIAITQAMPATSIDEVISALELIIKDSIETNNRMGYFAALYYKVTNRVKEGIENNEFDEGKRMEQLDVVFANRYLTALEQWKNSDNAISFSWKVVFDTTKRSSPLVLQHLLLGMNAHINLDLGIAAATIANTVAIEDIHKDFNAINTIISSLTYQVLNEISHVSPLLSLLGLHASSNNSVLIQFSIDNARDGAWCFAEDLYKRTGIDYTACIANRDNTIKLLANDLALQTGLLRFTAWLIHLFEWKNPSKIIRVLNEYKKARLATKGASLTVIEYQK